MGFVFIYGWKFGGSGGRSGIVGMVFVLLIMKMWFGMWNLCSFSKLIGLVLICVCNMYDSGLLFFVFYVSW